MDTLCDAAHETIESPATIYIECIIQYFETGGKCHLFGFRLSPYNGYLNNFSIGRGVTQQLEDGSTKLIQPGQQMSTGCMILLPTDIHEHYSIFRRTVKFESWKANALRFCWAVSDGLIELLEDVVLKIADDTEWYSNVRRLEEYPKIPFISSYKNKTGWMNSFIETTDEDEIDVVDLEDDDGDEELVARHNLLVQMEATRHDMADNSGSESAAKMAQ
jgi:hypothetical protein